MLNYLNHGENMNHSKISLKKTVENINNNHYVTPDFKGRRDFVWDVIDIEKLGDSMIRNIPITSVVLMPVESSRFPLKPSSIILLPSTEKPSAHNYIVDGYQRLTSISDIFLGTDSTFLYYFDMLAILNEKFLKTKEQSNSLVSYIALQRKTESISSVFCKSFNRTEPAQFTSRFVLASDVITNKFSRKVSKFLSELKDNGIINTEDEYYDYLDYLTSTFTAVAHYDIAISSISADSSDVFVKRTYEKLNSPLFGQ